MQIQTIPSFFEGEQNKILKSFFRNILSIKNFFSILKIKNFFCKKKLEKRSKFLFLEKMKKKSENEIILGKFKCQKRQVQNKNANLFQNFI